jgi:hypothetical protein
MPLKEPAYSAELKTACEAAIQHPDIHQQTASPQRGRRSLMKASATKESAKPSVSGAAVTLPVYVLSLRALMKGRGMGDAKLVGYQMLTSYGGRPVMAEVALDGQAGRRCASRITGPVADAALTSYRKVEKLKEIKGKTYEPRMLRIPALRIDAFWLRGSDDAGHDQDWIVPYHTYSQELLRKTVVRLPAFLATIQPLVQREVQRARPED